MKENQEHILSGIISKTITSDLKIILIRRGSRKNKTAFSIDHDGDILLWDFYIETNEGRLFNIKDYPELENLKLTEIELFEMVEMELKLREI